MLGTETQEIKYLKGTPQGVPQNNSQGSAQGTPTPGWVERGHGRPTEEVI